MSRFVLDCAVSGPVSDQAAQWLATAAQRAWASAAAGYHEGKVSQGLLSQSAATMAALVGGAGAWFTPDPASAMRAALDDVAGGNGFTAVATSAVDSVVVQEATAACAAANGLAHTILEVDSHGRIGPEALAELRGPAILATHVGNQEIGVLQTDLSRWSEETGSAVVLDASCAFGWTDLPQGWDRMVLDPRAWGAPAGAAVVVSTSGVRQRREFENVPAAATAALTGQQWLARAPGARERARSQIGRIRQRVLAEIPGIDVYGAESGCLPHVLSISVLYVDAEAVQTQLDARGYAVGSGSACASRSGAPSHVLAAIGGLTSGNLRVGLPPDLDDEIIEAFVDAVVQTVADVRAQMGTQGL